MKLLKLPIFLLLQFFAVNLYSQYYGENDISYEYGVGLGAMNCITDIGGAVKDKANYINEIQLNRSHFSPSIYGSVMYKGFFGTRLQATIGNVDAADSSITGKSNNLASKNNRNLNFRSKIAEIALLTEFHPLALINFEIFPFVSPYMLAGVGYYSFNPQTEYNGQLVDLQPLRLEGQGFAEFPDRTVYKLSGFNVPVGVGLRYEVSNSLNIRVEFLHRILFTDYLDDASVKEYIDPALFSNYLSPSQAALARALQNRSKDGTVPIYRGHNKDKDAYMSLSLKLGLTLGRESGGRSGDRQLKCFF